VEGIIKQLEQERKLCEERRKRNIDDNKKIEVLQDQLEELQIKLDAYQMEGGAVVQARQKGVKEAPRVSDWGDFADSSVKHKQGGMGELVQTETVRLRDKTFSEAEQLDVQDSAILQQDSDRYSYMLEQYSSQKISIPLNLGGLKQDEEEVKQAHLTSRFG